jgi:GAF domain-containing protein
MDIEIERDNYETAEYEMQEIMKDMESSLIKFWIVQYLNTKFSHYNWVGIYLVEGDNLVLGPWAGSQPTEHVTLPIGQGVCGSAASSGKTEVVPDVNADNRYISCFPNTKSEIVVPIKKNGRIIGEIDIDSDVENSFTEKDIKFLERIADMLSEHI